MPELPEVETVRRELSKDILGKKITDIDIRSSVIVKNNASEFKKLLVGHSIYKINRIGKLLKLYINDNKHLILVHLRMTGQLLFDHPIDKHCHVIIKFDDKSKLIYRDVRKFGYLKLIKISELDLVRSRYGIEPLQENFKEEDFKNIFKKRKKSLKAILLDQNLIAGLGNIYVDEICFRAGVRPNRKADKLRNKEITKLHQACDEIIAKAIKYNGTTFRDYSRPGGNMGNYREHLQVYGRDGQKCFNCSHDILKTKLAGRGTHYCRFCQK